MEMIRAVVRVATHAYAVALPVVAGGLLVLGRPLLAGVTVAVAVLSVSVLRWVAYLVERLAGIPCENDCGVVPTRLVLCLSEPDLVHRLCADCAEAHHATFGGVARRFT